MSNEDICREIVASNAGEAYFKCLTLIPDPATHPHWTAPFLVALIVAFIIVGLIATFV